MGYLAKMPKKKPERMMTDRTAGYVADITYTHGYYAELDPLHAQTAFAQELAAVGDNGAQLSDQAFAEQRLPLLKALQIA
jgi:hypothetical protein